MKRTIIILIILAFFMQSKCYARVMGYHCGKDNTKWKDLKFKKEGKYTCILKVPKNIPRDARVMFEPWFKEDSYLAVALFGIKWWGECGNGKNGLKLHIEADKMNYHPKDEIHIIGYVWNTSDKPIVLPRFFGLDYPRFKKGSVNMLIVGSAAYEMVVSEGPLYCIEPGEIKIYTVKHEIPEDVVGENILVTCTFSAKKDDETVKVWEGSIDSNELSIKVIKK